MQRIIFFFRSLFLFNKQKIKLLSLDFESLYSIIRLDHALHTIVNFMKNKISTKHLTIIVFYHLLKLLFSNNFFTFDKRYFKQIKGIAIGA